MKKHPARTTTGEDFPVTVTRAAEPDTWREALRAAGGDHRRLRVEADGRVSVLNKSAETPWPETLPR